MTFNLFFLSITIQKRQLSREEIESENRVKKMMDEIKDRKYQLYRHY